MADNQNPNPPPPPPSSSSSNSKVSGEINHSGNSGHHYPNPPEIGYNVSNSHKKRYPNPPDTTIPDSATLREQWRFATRQYSRWYSQAWGSAILAGMAFFALGWIVKGSNPLPSFGKNEDETKKKSREQQQQEEDGHDVRSPPVPPSLSSNPRDAYETSKS